ncbi:dihydroxyacetone kinase phosphoryl donor subunit DhaM [Microbacterium karelineae]|uniref:dihydroxyacetone kinase phosphoryl donor subunit DhaM n=1 Tax=Microbacterium karelineae TaxID=2654283 RepID=UPI0012EA7B0B|nr:dihydroxyacetone kinase phosphoryl donor subunit DhaM [Microbacterium karelineae]
MIGIVVVSHSAPLARAALDLALEMVPEDPPHVALAAGAGEGITGTDATRVADAISAVSGDDGVLVLMDLGSAVMSAEMALEFIDPGCEVRLTPAPLVEGLVAVVVSAAGGATLDEADREARGALAAKEDQLGVAGPEADHESEAADAAPDVGAPAGVRLTLTNDVGLHARPAGLVVRALKGLDVEVRIGTDAHAPVDARSLMGLMSLGAAHGDVIAVTAEGPDAARALDAIRELVENGFGEDAAE